MSSALPIYWKLEPESPLSADEASWVADDTALYFTSLEDNDGKLEQDASVYESKAEIAAKLLEGLDNLEDLDDWIKIEEPFSNWLEDKMLPIFDNMQSPPVAIKAEIKPPMVPDTQSLLKEFETVFDAVEMVHGALTPPQTPPYEQPILTQLEPIVVQPVYATPTKPTFIPIPAKPDFISIKSDYILPNTLSAKTDYTINKQDYLVPEKPLGAGVAAAFTRPNELQLEYINSATPQPDVAHELAVVEELVRTRVEDMVQWSDPSSPSNCSSGSSNFGDCSSDDPEWIPEPVDTIPQSSPSKVSRKRSKPYIRNVEDKKFRKKEQNKNAATRYRMKKKAEIAEILEEERGLATQNKELENQITDIHREIKCLKSLMRDLFKAKGLIN